MLYDSLLGGPFPDSRAYLTSDEAARRAERKTYTEDGVEHWAVVHPVETCWDECGSPSLPHFWTDDGALHVQTPRVPSRVDVTLPDSRGREVYTARVFRFEERGDCEVLGWEDGLDFDYDSVWNSYGTPTWHLSCGHTIEGTDRPNYCPTCGRRVDTEE